jgi:hypothetical protein
MFLRDICDVGTTAATAHPVSMFGLVCLTILRLMVATVFGGTIALIVLATCLYYAHASLVLHENILLASPISGFLDIQNEDFSSPAATVTYYGLAAASVTALSTIWICFRSSIMHGVFLIGLALLLLSMTALLVALTPDMSIPWTDLPMLLQSELVGTTPHLFIYIYIYVGD